MTKEEMIASLKAKKLHEADNSVVKNADDTVKNIDVTDTKVPATEAPDLLKDLPTQKAIEKAVADAIKTLVSANKEGVSCNGGESDLMDADKIEAEKSKQDSEMKDVINVGTRKVEESTEVSNELLVRLEESTKREQELKEQVAKMNDLCKKALFTQKNDLINEHAKEMKEIFDLILAEGKKIEKDLTASVDRSVKLHKDTQKLLEGSSKLNKILLESVKKMTPARKMTRYVTPARRALESVSK